MLQLRIEWAAFHKRRTGNVLCELGKGEIPPNSGIKVIFMEEVTVELGFEKWLRFSHIEIFLWWK